MVDEESLVLDNEVTIAIRDMLLELYPTRERDPMAFIRLCRIPMRNMAVDKYREISDNLRAGGFDTTELDNAIAFEQTKTDTVYHP